MMQYTVVYERGPRNWSAYSPDVPGCVAAAESRAEIERVFQEALVFHIAELREDGQPVPEPTTEAGTVLVNV